MVTHITNCDYCGRPIHISPGYVSDCHQWDDNGGVKYMKCDQCSEYERVTGEELAARDRGDE